MAPIRQARRARDGGAVAPRRIAERNAPDAVGDDNDQASRIDDVIVNIRYTAGVMARCTPAVVRNSAEGGEKVEKVTVLAEGLKEILLGLQGEKMAERYLQTYMNM